MIGTAHTSAGILRRVQATSAARGARQLTSPINRQFGRAVREHRLALELTQRTVASRSGLPVETISRIEHARGNPTLSTMEAIARALGVELHELLRAPSSKAGPLEALVAQLTAQPREIQARALSIVRALLRDRSPR